MSEESESSPKGHLMDQALLIIYKRLIAIGLACTVAGTSKWEFPFPRGLFLQAGVFMISSGFLLFAAIAILQEIPDLVEVPDSPMDQASAFDILPEGATPDPRRGTVTTRPSVGRLGIDVRVLYVALSVMVLLSFATLGAGSFALRELGSCFLTDESELCTKKLEQYNDADRKALSRSRHPFQRS